MYECLLGKRLEKLKLFLLHEDNRYALENTIRKRKSCFIGSEEFNIN